MLYLCDLLFTFSLIFIVINHITSFKQQYWYFVRFLEYLPLFLDDNVNKEINSNNKISASGCCLLFSFLGQFQHGVAYKSVAYEKIKKIVWFL